MSDQARETRDCEFPFTLERSADGGDGLDFQGYAAVFNSPTAIRDQDGEYTETIAPGAFKRSIAAKPPVLMFDHGKHPLLGQMPLGRITDIREDPRGLFVKARLSDNWLVKPVRDAIAEGAITGMSFRFEVIKDDWTPVRGGKRVRTLREVRAPEVGPVVFPAYSDTTASVRSAIAVLAEQYPDVVHVELRDDDSESMSVGDLVAEAIEKLWGLEDPMSDAKLIDVFADHVLFTVGGTGQVDHPGLWQVTYSYTDGTVTIGEPSRPPIAGYSEGDNSPSEANNITNPAYNNAPLEGDERAYSADDLKTMAANGQAMPDGSYPIANKTDLQNAIRAVGRGAGSHDAIRKHIMRRAKALDAMDMIPDTWMASGAMQMNSQDLSTSDELAVTGTSEEPAVAIIPAKSREQIIREIQLRERGIRLPKGA